MATIKKKHIFSFIENEMTHIVNVSMGAHLNNNKLPKCLRMVSTYTCILVVHSATVHTLTNVPFEETGKQ